MKQLLLKLLELLIGKLTRGSVTEQAPSGHLAAYKLAKKYRGLKELPGNKHEKQIIEFFEDVGHSWVKDDETFWCAAFVGAMLERSGVPSTKKLNARSYLEWGQAVKLEDLKEGDIVVFWRGSKSSWEGHVAFFVGFDPAGDLLVLGGNQSNMVNVQKYSKSRFLSGRRG